MSMCGCLSHTSSGDLAHNPGMCPDWVLNWQPLGSQVRAQSTEPHQPGLITIILNSAFGILFLFWYFYLVFCCYFVSISSISFHSFSGDFSCSFLCV